MQMGGAVQNGPHAIAETDKPKDSNFSRQADMRVAELRVVSIAIQ